MSGAEFYTDVLVYTYLSTLGLMTFVLSFAWGFVKFVLPRWWEEEAARGVKRTPAMASPKAA